MSHPMGVTLYSGFKINVKVSLIFISSKWIFQYIKNDFILCLNVCIRVHG